MTREIALDASPGMTTLTHELVHPIVQTDFPHAPAWLDEALGSLYEAPLFPRPGEIHGAKNWRWSRLARALASKTESRTARIDALLSMSDRDFRGGDRDLHYATARYLAQWLDARDALWPFYRAWRDGFAEDPSGEKSFRASVGKTPAEANEEWAAWVRGL